MDSIGYFTTASRGLRCYCMPLVSKTETTHDPQQLGYICIRFLFFLEWKCFFSARRVIYRSVYAADWVIPRRAGRPTAALVVTPYCREQTKRAPACDISRL